MTNNVLSMGLKAALDYAKSGWPILPLDDSLTPIEHEPTIDQETLVRWWARHPSAVPGAALGRSVGGSRQKIVALLDECTKESTDFVMSRGDIGLGHIMCGTSRAWLFVTAEELPSRELAPGLAVKFDGVLPLPPASTERGSWRWRKGHFMPDRPLIAAPYWLRIAEPEFPPTLDEPAVSHEWVAELKRDKNKQIKPTLGNATLILRCADRYAGKLTYDEMSMSVLYDGKPLGDAGVLDLRNRLELTYGAVFNDTVTRDALLLVTDSKKFHPVRRYLQELKWDGIARIDHLAKDILGAADDQPLASSMLRKFFIAAVSRALSPGCKVDNSLVLVGPQGCRKSTFFRVLAGQWFSDTHLDPTNKDSLQQIAAAWIYELGEVDSITSRKHASDLKRFMTSATDAFRPPYERSVRIVPRSGVLVGTTNIERFLTDETGSRRFWIVRITGRINIEELAKQRDQLWAEAVAVLRTGEDWWLTDAEETVRESEADRYSEQDPWTEKVKAYFRTQLRSKVLRSDYTSAEISTSACGVEKQDLTKATEMRVGKILKDLGLLRKKIRIVRDGLKLDPARTWEWPEEQPVWIDVETFYGGLN